MTPQDVQLKLLFELAARIVFAANLEHQSRALSTCRVSSAQHFSCAHRVLSSVDVTCRMRFAQVRNRGSRAAFAVQAVSLCRVALDAVQCTNGPTDVFLGIVEERIRSFLPLVGAVAVDKNEDVG